MIVAGLLNQKSNFNFPLFDLVVLSTLRHLSTTTSILSDPTLMPEQAIQAVNQISKSSGES